MPIYSHSKSYYHSRILQGTEYPFKPILPSDIPVSLVGICPTFVAVSHGMAVQRMASPVMA